jgi:hypothetical protein
MTDASAAERAKLVTRIRDALARGEGELGIDVTVDGVVVILRGVVQTDDRRWRLEELSRLVSAGAGFAVVNEITVQPPESPAMPETVS